MDTLLVKKLAEIMVVQDSVLKHTNKIQETINSNKPSLLLQLLPFIGVVVGGVMAYVGQNSIKNKELKSAKLTTISATVNKIFSNLTCLTFHLKELAYLEVDSKYQYYLSNTENGKLKDRALEEHYADYKYIADLKSKIAIASSEIHSCFNYYYRLTNQEMPANTSTALSGFANHLVNLRHHDTFDENEEIYADRIQECMDRLFEEYNGSVLPVRQIASSLS